jgi:hypothetical protein
MPISEQSFSNSYRVGLKITPLSKEVHSYTLIDVRCPPNSVGLSTRVRSLLK